MATKFPRKSLKVLRLYREMPTGLYFYTPDGTGVIWFANRDQAMEETGAFDLPVIGIGQELED